jgi:hypothetical protein
MQMAAFADNEEENCVARKQDIAQADARPVTSPNISYADGR